jgi:mono/diheme cytochrome c family protein
MGNSRVFSFLVALAILGTVGAVAIDEAAEGNATSRASWFMRGDTLRENPMNEMMNRMMPDLVPPGAGPRDLPDPESPGARLLVRYCEQCHGLPAPSMHTAAEWPAIVGRMVRRMSRMSGMGGMGMMARVEVPTPDEREIMLAYLEAHALKAASPRTLPSSQSKGAKLFRARCSQCHGLPDPKARTRAEWPATVEQMRGFMQAMDKKGITKDEEKEIVRYLQAHART